MPTEPFRNPSDIQADGSDKKFRISRRSRARRSQLPSSGIIRRRHALCAPRRKHKNSCRRRLVEISALFERRAGEEFFWRELRVGCPTRRGTKSFCLNSSVRSLTRRKSKVHFAAQTSMRTLGGTDLPSALELCASMVPSPSMRCCSICLLRMLLRVAHCGAKKQEAGTR